MHRQLSPHHLFPDRGEPPRVRITLLGGFRVAVDGVTSPARNWNRRTAAALVKILALAPGHRIHREKAMDLLWPDDSPAQAAPRLHKAAHFARRAAGHHNAVVLHDDLVWLFPGAAVTVDVLEFEDLARKAVGDNDPVAARDALDSFGGELLPTDRYEEWASDRRELLHLRRLDVLRVAGEWRELAELDPANEDAHMQLMRRHIDAGDGAAALRQFEHLERVLERDLGVLPGPAVSRTRLEASQLESCISSSRVEDLLAEMLDLVHRQSAVIAELAATGTVQPCCVP